MAEASGFWNKLASRYAASPIADEAAYQTKLEETRKLLRPGMRLLEFGCGTGGTAIRHAPHVAHIRAIDFSEKMLEFARARAREAGVENVTFELGDITTLPMPQERYDMVLGLSILHLLEDVDAVIAKVREMLVPGGYFVSSTACMNDIMPWFKYVAPLGKAIGKLPHLTFMSADDLVGKFQAAGFTIVHRWQPGKKAALFLIARKPG
ncbi:class I SAM-dependent methyltransferase [Pelagibacterium sp. 26DY04]|uniref:class I SAM-dependent methyltransferase n=1 Tax=Pelagibacterium sp. 26DY04 TaxID=2967130 RepID=UPI002816176A|nr:class I SAM-dependent methyltransferase [Pelagibacterium sp. 26DY04]WMT88117.1 class I SAM-dependent methyltransferase [Pelagibacterium sp. 26DY04]